MVDVVLSQVEPDREVALGAVRGGRGAGIARACSHIGGGELAEEVGAGLREVHVDHPPDSAGWIDARAGARDGVARQPGELGSVAGCDTSGYLGVCNPSRVDELGDRANGLLGLLGCDSGKVDGDPIVVVAGATHLRLAHAKGVDALEDDRDGPLLNVGARLAGREVGEQVVDVRSTGQVQALVDVNLPAAEVRGQARHASGERIVVHDPVDVAGPVDED